MRFAARAAELAEARGGAVGAALDDASERAGALGAPLEPVQLVAAEQILHRRVPERLVLGMVPAGGLRRSPADVDGRDSGDILHVAGSRLENACVDLHPPRPRRRDHFGEEIAIAVRETRVDLLVSQRRVLEVLVVVFDPDERQLARSLIDRRLAVVGREPLDRLTQVPAIRMAVGQERIDVGRLAAEVQARLDAFVEHRVRIHLDADEKVGASGSRCPAGRVVLTGVTGRSERCGERKGAGDAGETAEELASISHGQSSERSKPRTPSRPC